MDWRGLSIPTAGLKIKRTFVCVATATKTTATPTHLLGRPLPRKHVQQVLDLGLQLLHTEHKVPPLDLDHSAPSVHVVQPAGGGHCGGERGSGYVYTQKHNEQMGARRRMSE